jgi:hypothetical protein
MLQLTPAFQRGEPQTGKEAPTWLRNSDLNFTFPGRNIACSDNLSPICSHNSCLGFIRFSMLHEKYSGKSLSSSKPENAIRYDQMLKKN